MEANSTWAPVFRWIRCITDAGKKCNIMQSANKYCERSIIKYTFFAVVHDIANNSVLKYIKRVMLNYIMERRLRYRSDHIDEPRNSLRMWFYSVSKIFWIAFDQLYIFKVFFPVKWWIPAITIKNWTSFISILLSKNLGGNIPENGTTVCLLCQTNIWAKFKNSMELNE